MIATCLLLERIFNLLVTQKSAFRISKRRVCRVEIG